MALEHLLGPSIITSGGVNVIAPFRAHWLDHLGLCGFFSDHVFGAGAIHYQIVQYDGIAYTRNNDLSAFKARPLGYDFQTENLIITSPVGSVGTTLFDPYTGSWIFPQLTPGDLGICYRYFDRYLRVTGRILQSAPLTASSPAEFADEYTFPTPVGRTPAAVPGTLSDYGGGLIAVAFRSNGDIWIYDPANRTHVGEWKTVNFENEGLWYSQRFNVWLSQERKFSPNGHEIQVWANETRPFALSNPSALQPISRGLVSEIRVQLAGGSGEPISGQLVEFAIASGPGLLLNLQALTDVDGYALTRYSASSGASGSVQIDANTKF